MEHHSNMEGSTPNKKKRVGFTGEEPGISIITERPPSIVINNRRNTLSPATMSPDLYSPTESLYSMESRNRSRANSHDALLGIDPKRSHLPEVSIEDTESIRAAFADSHPRPRPVLRRGDSTSSITPDYLDTVQSMRAKEAHERGKRLEHAERITSAPISRRTSPTPKGAGARFTTNDIQLEEFAVQSDEEDIAPKKHSDIGNKHMSVPNVGNKHMSTSNRHTSINAKRQSAMHKEASKLVQAHTSHASHLLHQDHEAGGRSGAITPIEEAEEFEVHVPKPERYRGGVLGALLKLYNDQPGPSVRSRSNSMALPHAHVRSGSGPAAFDSLASTPVNSPPVSGASTPTRARASRPWYSRNGNNSSTSSLAHLVGSSASSAMGSSPVSGIGDQVAERLSQQQNGSIRSGIGKRSGSFVGRMSGSGRPRLEDEIRITIHIAETIARQRYLLKLCKALMQYGAPTHRLEEYMKMSSRVLEIDAQFLYIPGSMIMSFDDQSTHTTEVKLVKVAQGLDLSKLSDTHEVYKEVVHDRLGVEEATDRLQEVMQKGPKHNRWVLVPVYGFASACVGPFAFQARLIDTPPAFLLGCIVGFLQLIITPRSDLYANVFEVGAAVITSFLARAFGSIHGGNTLCFSALAQSSIALILPGYTVLCASLELQSRSLVAGSVRMVYAIIYTLFLGFGITVGTAIYGIMDENAVSDTTCSNPMKHHHFFWFVPLFTMCLIIINQAKWRQAPIMLVIAFVGYVVNYFTALRFSGNTQVSNTLGALSIGVMANTYSRMGSRVENKCLDIWEEKLRPHWRNGLKAVHEWYYGKSSIQMNPSIKLEDAEGGIIGDSESTLTRHTRKVGYGLAAAAMLPAIFVQVPSGLAVSGSLVSGITAANQISGNATNGTTVSTSTTSYQLEGNLNSIAFNVGFSVIQVAIGITVGLFLSAIVVYPLGKRRSGLFSF